MNEALIEWTGSNGERLAISPEGVVMCWVDDPEGSGWFPTDALAPLASEVMRGVHQFVNSHNKYKDRAKTAAHMAHNLRQWAKMLLDGKAPHSGQRMLIVHDLRFCDGPIAGWIEEEKAATNSP